MTTPRWYMVNKMGMATLCANKADAQQEAADAQSLWPDMGPHRAVQLVEAAQQESFDRSPQATSIEEAARDVGKWLNERPNRPIDLRHVAMLCAHATAAPQQEAQEPVAWYVTGCGRLLDEDEAKAEARHIGGTARAIPVYTAPQPLPASQGDELDAARLDWLDEDDGSHVSKVGKTWYTRPTYGRPYRKHKNLRAAIDAARKQGANHD